MNKEKEFSNYGKKVDLVVKKHMEIIINEIKREIPDIISILAIGGLGRGEGSFLIKKRKLLPLNDYDIYLITSRKVDFKILEKISKRATLRISKKSKFSFSESSSLMEFYVDLRNMTINELKKVEPMIKYYEIRESAKIIYGKDVRKEMPKFSIEDIPLEEGFRFLMNRMSLLIECFDTDNLESPKTKKTIWYYMGKNYLTCAEALLLLNRKFVCSYKKRAEIFKENYKKDFSELHHQIPELSKRIGSFTKNKLRPKEKFFEKNPKESWMNARGDLLKVINFYIKEAFNLKSSNAEELSFNIKKLNKSFLKNYLKIFIKSKFKINLPDIFLIPLSIIGKIYFNYLYYKRNYLLNKKIKLRLLFSLKDINLKIYSICPLVLFSLNQDLSLNKKNFNKSKKMIESLKDSKDIFDWQTLRKKYADIFRTYQFLKN